MSLIIKAQGLGKQYRIGTDRSVYSTLRESLVAKLRSPLNRARRNGQEEKIWALRDVNFDVNQGEVVGIIGRNGAGKSTLLKILSRITEPTTGRVELRGRVGSLLEVGTGFHPELTGRENILLNGSILGMSRQEILKRFDDIVSFAEIEKFVDTPVKRYSSGMYLRLAFAVAAHLEPEILMVDEVLAVGDVQFQKKCLGKLEEVASQGRTVLFVSHNMAAIQRLCTRGILLSDGEITCDGDARTAVQQYLTVGLKQSGERVWQDQTAAPGDKVVRFKAVRALNDKSQVSSEFSVRDQWHLEVEFHVLAPDFYVNVYLLLYDEAGSLMFFVGDFQDPEWEKKTRRVGVHRSRCIIPKDFLNEGNIRVLAGLVSPPSTLRAIERDAISVRINEDLSTIGARGYYPGPWPGGAVRPSLQWEFGYTP